MNEMLVFQLVDFAAMGLLTLLSLGILLVGLVYVRRVNVMAGLCMAGAGGLGALGAVIRRIMSLAINIGGGGYMLLTLSQIFTTLLAIVASALLPVAIFLLANAVKQGTRQGP